MIQQNQQRHRLRSQINSDADESKSKVPSKKRKQDAKEILYIKRV